MRSRTINFVVFLLIATLPIRAAAAAMPSLCAEGQAQAASLAHGHGDRGDHGASPRHEEGSTGDLDHDCGFCAKHCNGGSFALTAGRPFVFAPPGVDAVN